MPWSRSSPSHTGIRKVAAEIIRTASVARQYDPGTAIWWGSPPVRPGDDLLLQPRQAADGAAAAGRRVPPDRQPPLGVPERRRARAAVVGVLDAALRPAAVPDQVARRRRADPSQPPP